MKFGHEFKEWMRSLSRMKFSDLKATGAETFDHFRKRFGWSKKTRNRFVEDFDRRFGFVREFLGHKPVPGWFLTTPSAIDKLKLRSFYAVDSNLAGIARSWNKANPHLSAVTEARVLAMFEYNEAIEHLWIGAVSSARPESRPGFKYSSGWHIVDKSGTFDIHVSLNDNPMPAAYFRANTYIERFDEIHLPMPLVLEWIFAGEQSIDVLRTLDAHFRHQRLSGQSERLSYAKIQTLMKRVLNR